MRNAIAAVAIFAAGAAHAGACGPDRESDIALIEEAKRAFLESDYDEFVRIAGPYFPNLANEFDAYFGPLQRVIPQGFDRCETVLQRREAPGFNQELVFYFPKGSPAPMALHIVVAEVDGEHRIVEFTYNTSISDVLDELK
jgi:hypothetical protein